MNKTNWCCKSFTEQECLNDTWTALKTFFAATQGLLMLIVKELQFFSYVLLHITYFSNIIFTKRNYLFFL